MSVGVIRGWAMSDVQVGMTILVLELKLHIAESLETDLASTVIEKKKMTPDGIL